MKSFRGLKLINQVAGGYEYAYTYQQLNNALQINLNSLFLLFDYFFPFRNLYS
jgi:hypothetical protein